MELDPAQLRALRAAVDEGTFEAAARLLHVTPSAVSQRIKALENSVGRVLLTRTKPVQATESGQAVLRYARQLDTLTSDVERQLGRRSDPGDEGGGRITLPLAVNADSLSTWVLPAVADLDPMICLDFYREDQDYTLELLRAGTVMAVITSTAQPVPGCRSIGLGRMRYRPMAGAAFAARWFPDGATPRELAGAPMICFDRVDTMQDAYLHRRSRQQLDPPRHFVPSSGEMLGAVVLGLGWGMLPDLQADELQASGRLVELDPRGATEVALYWQQWRLNSPALDLVSGAIHRYARAHLR